MSFYQQLSQYYDEIFSFDQAETDFMRQWLADMPSLLDVGCATGNKTALFAGQIKQITGIDADAQMIEIAQQKHHAPNIDYQVMDMRLISRHFAENSFAALVCLGNTLVHLDSSQAIARLVNDMARLATKRIIIQTVNYDRVIDEQISELPAIETAQTHFTRQYAWRDGKLHFITSLLLKANKQQYQNDIVLTPLRKPQLASMLTQAGLSSQQFYGDFTGQQWQQNSFATIVVANKENTV